MKNEYVDRQDSRVSDLLRRIENIGKDLGKVPVPTRRTFNGKRFITDNELSRIFKISRRTLQEYRTSGLIPYYLICGKVLYDEGEIQHLLEDSRKRTISEQELL